VEERPVTHPANPEPPTGPTVAEAIERLTRFIPYSGPQRRDLETLLSALKARTEALERALVPLEKIYGVKYHACIAMRRALAEGGERL
jgi:hypothetical protein